MLSGPVIGVGGVLALLWALTSCADSVRYAASHPGDPAGYVITAAYAGLAIVAARTAVAGLAHTAGTVMSALPGRRSAAADLFALAARSSPLLIRYALIGFTGVSAVGCAAQSPAPEKSQQSIVDPGWTAEHDDPAPTAHAPRSHVPTQGEPAHGKPAPSAHATPGDTGDTVRVRPGDTLWSIAAASLPPNAGSSDVAAAWPRWYRVNRHVIGDDPDLLLPGQRLDRPSS